MTATRVALFFCLSALVYYPMVILGCLCTDESFTLTDLQSVCSDYQFASHVFTARVINRESQCLEPDEPDCSEYSYIVEVVNVFKGDHQVGDRLTDQGPDTLTSCGNPFHILNISATYLVGIGGPCSIIGEYSPINRVSDEIIQAITNSCDSCPYVIVHFEQSNYRVDESSGIVSAELALSNSLSADITIQIESKDINATGNQDYIPGPYNATFSAGSTKATLNIAIFNDNLQEGNEAFMLTISEDSLPTCAFVHRNYIGESRVTIVDDERSAIISFEFPKYTVQENSGKVQAALVLSRTVSTPVKVRVNTRDGTATGNGVDYNSGPYQIDFPPGVAKVSFDVLINDDGVSERKERFRLIIKKNSLPSGISLGKNRRATVTILN